MKYYTLAKKIKTNCGHGCNYDEYVIKTKKDGYETLTKEFHPIFEKLTDLIDYLKDIDYPNSYEIVDLYVYRS